jgi:hypothetical protein
MYQEMSDGKGIYRLRIGTAAVSALIPFQYIVPTSIARYDGVVLLSTVDFRLVKGSLAHCLLKCFFIEMSEVAKVSVG